MPASGRFRRGSRNATSAPYAIAPATAHNTSGTPARIATDAPTPPATIAEGAVIASAVRRDFRCSGSFSMLMFSAQRAARAPTRAAPDTGAAFLVSGLEVAHDRGEDL